MDKLTDDPTKWVTISEAAPRLGLSPFGVRSRIRRGTLRTKPGNDGRRLVGIPADHPADHSLSNSTGNSKDHSADHLNGHEAAAEVERWRTAAETARVATARAEGELAAEARRSADLMAALAAERTRAEGECTALRAQVAALQAELALARKGWLERVLEALRRR